MSKASAMDLVRSGIYQAAGGALFVGGMGLVLLWLNPPPKATDAAKTPCGCTKTTQTVYR